MSEAELRRERFGPANWRKTDERAIGQATGRDRSKGSTTVVAIEPR